MEEFVIVLSVGKPYNFVPEGSTETLSGATMWYIATDDIKTKKFDPDSEVIGCVPLKQNMGVEFYNVVKEVGLPAKARVEYGMKNSGGKQVLYIKGLDFIKDK